MRKKTVREKRRFLSLLLTAALLLRYAGQYGHCYAYGLSQDSALRFEEDGIPAESEGENQRVYETTVRISSEEDFQALAGQCREESFSEGKVFVLEADLDFSEKEVSSIPVMNGIFEGNGHIIQGVILDEEMSDYGLFRYVGENGKIRNVTVEAEITGGGGQENIGILAGSNGGEIENCTVRGLASGSFQTGGIVGFNEETGLISRSYNQAQVDGKNSTGGIAGRNEGEISDCANTGSVNTAQRMKKALDGDGSVAISIPNAVAGLTKDERANQTGGIAGFSSGEISYCTNKGIVGYEHLGSITGGIVGWQSGSISNCQNEGTVYGRKNVGGIAGYFDPYEARAYDRDFREELSDSLDALSDAVDSLQDAADQMGGHLSENLDVLSGQMESLRDSIRGYLDDYEDMADSDKDEIRSQVNDVKDTIEGMEYDFSLDKILGHMDAIQEDMGQMQEILDKMLSTAEEAGGEVKEELLPLIEKYQKWMEQIEKLKKKIEDIIKNLPNVGNNGESLGTEEKNSGESQTAEETGEEPENEDNSLSGNGAPSANSGGIVRASLGAPTVFLKKGEAEKSEEKSGEDVENGQGTSGAGTGESTQESSSQEEKGTEGSGSQEEKGTEESGSQTEHSTEESSKGTEESTEKIDQKLKKLWESLAADMKRLEELNADIQNHLQGTMDTLDRIPEEMDNIHDDISQLKDNLDALDNTVRGSLDAWGDELSAMKADLREEGEGISSSLDAAGDTLDGDWDVIFDRIDSLKEQFTNIRATVSDSFDELKNRIEDKNIYVDSSMLMADGKGKGKIYSCENTGEIYCDSEGGGIVGSISKETGEETLNWPFDMFDGAGDGGDEDSGGRITRHVQAAVIRCVNLGQITVTDDYAGGIVGKASYGVIRKSENYADVVTNGGQYVGGIAGKSELRIQDCYMLGGVSGSAYVGGVAGEGEDLSGNYVCSYLDLDEDFVEAGGAVAGKAGGDVENNYFVDNGYGAIDGITRQENAIATDYSSMLEMKNMPENFKQFTVRFKDGEDIVWEKIFSYGDSLAAQEYPELLDPEAGYAYWEDKDLGFINRSVTIHSVYRAYIPSLVSDLGGSQPELLLGGEFYPDTVLGVREATEDEKERIQEALKGKKRFGKYVVTHAYYYQLSQKEELNSQVSLRVLDHFHGDRLLVLSDDLEPSGGVEKAQAVGSYMAVRTSLGGSGYVAVIYTVEPWSVVIAGAAALGLLALVVWLFRRRRVRKKAGEPVKDESGQGQGPDGEETPEADH